MKRDSIDFASEPVGALFRKMLFPTLAGMISIVVLNITDGAFIGRGVGSNGIAAVNIAAPIFTFITGIGLMFGGGCSIVTSIHLSKGNRKAADINVTQALLATLIVSVIFGGVILLNLEATARLFGSSDALLEDVCAYLKWVAAFIPLNMLGIVGEFIIRLDGSPKYAMSCTLAAAFMNIFLDWLFIFPFGWGVEGAAFATGISFAFAGLMSVIYMLFFTKSLHLYRLKMSLTSLRLSLRNIGYQIRMGFSSLLAESAVSCSIIIGNYIFMKYLGEAGVAAYSVACYCIPTAFMLANAISQAAQPIISFAHGSEDRRRALHTRNVSLKTGLVAGAAGSAVLGFGAAPVTSIFLSSSENAWALSVAGLPFFSLAAVFICINVVLIGYYQSIEQAGKAVIFTLLRGFIFIIPCFVLMPVVLGNGSAPGTPGIWLATPISEAATTAVMLVVAMIQKGYRPRSSRHIHDGKYED